MNNERSLYDILGVDSRASTEQIKRAYRKKAMQLHPDRGGKEIDGVRFADVSAAYDVLGNPLKRVQYDWLGSDDMAGVAACMLSGCCCCGIFMFLGLLRWSGLVYIPWVMVFTPIWIFDISLIPVIVAGAVSSWSDKFMSFNASCLLVFTVLLYMHTDAYITSWLLTLSPLITAGIVEGITGINVGYHELDPPHWGWWSRAARAPWWEVVFLLLTGLKLDSQIHIMWWTVFLVLYVKSVIGYIASPLNDSEYRMLELVYQLSLYVFLGSFTSGIAWSISIPLLLITYLFKGCAPLSDVTLPCTVSLPPQDISQSAPTHSSYHTVDID